jgi:hypothetical protein
MQLAEALVAPCLCTHPPDSMVLERLLPCYVVCSARHQRSWVILARNTRLSMVASSPFAEKKKKKKKKNRCSACVPQPIHTCVQSPSCNQNPRLQLPCKTRHGRGMGKTTHVLSRKLKTEQTGFWEMISLRKTFLISYFINHQIICTTGPVGATKIKEREKKKKEKKDFHASFTTPVQNISKGAKQGYLPI